MGSTLKTKNHPKTSKKTRFRIFQGLLRAVSLLFLSLRYLSSFSYASCQYPRDCSFIHSPVPAEFIQFASRVSFRGLTRFLFTSKITNHRHVKLERIMRVLGILKVIRRRKVRP